MPDVNQVYVSQFDVTNEVLGFFYAADNWRDKWNNLKNELEGSFNCTLKDNHNSFNSCFQFV